MKEKGIGTYRFKVLDEAGKATLEMIWTSPTLPDAAAFDNFVTLFKEKFPELGEGMRSEGDDLEKKNPERMNQKEFEKMRMRRGAKPF